MRAVVLSLLLLAPGCVVLAARPTCDGEGPPLSLDSPGGDSLAVHVLHDGRPSRDATVCVVLDGHAPLDQRMPERSAVPNVETAARGRYLGAGPLRVTAWIAGEEARATAVFDRTAENVLVVRIGGDYEVHLEKHDRPVAFA